MAATRRAVLDGFRWLRSSARDGDLCVVHFSGYEIYEERGRFNRFFLMTADSDSDNPEQTALSRESIADAVAEIPGRVLFLLDTCHSEAAAKPITAQNPQAAVFAACRDQRARQAKARRPRGVLFLSGRDRSGRPGRPGQGRIRHARRIGALRHAARCSDRSDHQHPILVKPDDFPSLTLTQPKGEPAAPAWAGTRLDVSGRAKVVKLRAVCRNLVCAQATAKPPTTDRFKGSLDCSRPRSTNRANVSLHLDSFPRNERIETTESHLTEVCETRADCIDP